jgi:hypothetical protein
MVTGIWLENALDHADCNHPPESLNPCQREVFHAHI